MVLMILHLCCTSVFSQLPDSCKLSFGTNLGGLADWGTELPFKDRMRNCREWYTKDAGNPENPWDTGMADSLSYRPDGYPTHIPQNIPGGSYPQRVATVWAFTSGWEAGQYVVLFDGEGSLEFWGGLENLVQTSSNRYTFDFFYPEENILQLTIMESSIDNPVRNIRVINSEYESNYQTEPFNPVWLSKLLMFKSIRFMDWGATNNWGQPDGWTWDNPELASWSERARMDSYTWANNKGIPYEMMIRLMNDYHLDGWVCVPHTADNDYIMQMAHLFHDQLDPNRKLTVEYSNEIWNWMFGQTHWLYQLGCVQQGQIWPEGIVPYIQNCMDIWTSVYGSDSVRLIRAVGCQTAWLDVSQRIAFNMRPGSFDAVSPAYYFGLSSEILEAELDALGSNATVSDVAVRVRQSRDENEKIWMSAIKNQLADPLNLPIAFYEGGQHITPNPFGAEPSYAQALLDIQRDTAMYNLYREWFIFLRSLQTGSRPLQCMNFSFIGSRSARYGSWGILETMDQDTSEIPAPKYKAMAENLYPGCTLCQDILIPAGWSGVSGYLYPADSALPVLLNPVVEDFVILQNLSGAYYPENNVQTLQHWNHENGYMIKMNESRRLTLHGSPLSDLSVHLLQGWNLIPVKVNHPVLTSELDMKLNGHLLIITEIAGPEVYWPQMQVYTLTSLVPGRSYLINVDSDIIFTYQ